MSLRPSGRVDAIAALSLVAAFVLAGWKIFNRLLAVSYAGVPQQVASPGAALKAPPNAGLPPQQLSPDGRFRFDAQFVSAASGQAVHVASIVELAGGDLRAVWFSASREGAGDVSIRTAVMDAASLRWSVENTRFDRQQIQRGLWRQVRRGQSDRLPS